MSASNEFETALLNLYLKNTGHANVGDATGILPAGTAGSIYVSLHTANPTDTGDQTTSETSYTGYARVAVARSGAGWTVSGGNGSNAAAVTFGECTVGTPTITYFGLGSASSGAGHLFFWGALGASLAVSPGVIPEFAIGDLDVDFD